jgi:hypothetical protein
MQFCFFRGGMILSSVSLLAEKETRFFNRSNTTSSMSTFRTPGMDSSRYRGLFQLIFNESMKS